jgi:hypothetical protein
MSYMTSISLNGWQHNKKIKPLTAFAGTHTRGRLRHYRPRACAPYLKVIHHPLFSNNQTKVQRFFTTALGVRFSLWLASKVT